MQIIVKKFGGTSVGSIERIKHVAEIIARSYNAGENVVVVLSAMSGITDSLVDMASQAFSVTATISAVQGTAPASINKQILDQLPEYEQVSGVWSPPALSEYDSILSSGEQVSAGLLALALQSLGLKARSYLGWQLPIKTDGNFANGNIIEVNTTPVIDSLHSGEIPVICGFQGIFEGRIVTLGRGGSDITAAAVAASLMAIQCDIYTDIPGIFTSDPKVVEKAMQINEISYCEMLEMAAAGAKVLHPRAVEIAMHAKLKMRVLSTFEDGPGTTLTKNNTTVSGSSRTLTGIAGCRDIAILVIFCFEGLKLLKERIHELFKSNSVAAKELSQGVGHDTQDSVAFMIDKSEINKVQQIFSKESQLRDVKYTLNSEVARVALVGSNIVGQPSILQKMFHILSEKGINVLAIAASEAKVTVLVDAVHKELAMRSLHTVFDLDKKE